jgi:hypothetical protein
MQALSVAPSLTGLQPKSTSAGAAAALAAGPSATAQGQAGPMAGPGSAGAACSGCPLLPPTFPGLAAAAGCQAGPAGEEDALQLLLLPFSGLQGGAAAGLLSPLQAALMQLPELPTGGWGPCCPMRT